MQVIKKWAEGRWLTGLEYMLYMWGLLSPKPPGPLSTTWLVRCDPHTQKLIIKDSLKLSKSTTRNVHANTAKALAWALYWQRQWKTETQAYHLGLWDSLKLEVSQPVPSIVIFYLSVSQTFGSWETFGSWIMLNTEDSHFHLCKWFIYWKFKSWRKLKCVPLNIATILLHVNK